MRRGTNGGLRAAVDSEGDSEDPTRMAGNGRDSWRDPEVEKSNCCGAMMGVASIGLLISGMALIWTADYETVRTALGESYNGAVSEWTSTYAQPFIETKWELLQNGTSYLDLVPDHSADQLKNNNTLLLSYTASAFRGRGLLTGGDLSMTAEAAPVPDVEDGEIVDEGAPAPPTKAIMVDADMMKDRTFTLRATTSGVVSDIVLGNMALVRKAIVRASSWKACRYQHMGWWGGKQCTTYASLEAICVKVAQSADGSWALDNRYGGTGCSPRNVWSPVKRRRIRAPPQGALPRLPISQYMGIVTVRSAADPYLFAQNITEGSGVLATRQAEEKAMGVICLIIGGVLVLPACFLLQPLQWCGYGGSPKKARSRRGRKVYYEEFSDL